MVAVGGSWRATDEHGVLVTVQPSWAEAVALVSNAGTDELPITVTVRSEDGEVETERTFPAPPTMAADSATSPDPGLVAWIGTVDRPEGGGG